MSAKSPRRADPSWLPDVRMTVVSVVSSRKGAAHPRERIHGWNCAIEHVARDEDGIHAALTYEGDQPVDKRVRALAQRHAVQGASQMPVGGVQNQHATSVAEGAHICVRHTRLESGHELRLCSQPIAWWV